MNHILNSSPGLPFNIFHNISISIININESGSPGSARCCTRKKVLGILFMNEHIVFFGVSGGGLLLARCVDKCFQCI